MTSADRVKHYLPAAAQLPISPLKTSLEVLSPMTSLIQEPNIKVKHDVKAPEEPAA